MYGVESSSAIRPGVVDLFRSVIYIHTCRLTPKSVNPTRKNKPPTYFFFLFPAHSTTPTVATHSFRKQVTTTIDDKLIPLYFLFCGINLLKFVVISCGPPNNSYLTISRKGCLSTRNAATHPNPWPVVATGLACHPLVPLPLSLSNCFSVCFNPILSQITGGVSTPEKRSPA